MAEENKNLNEEEINTVDENENSEDQSNEETGKSGNKKPEGKNNKDDKSGNNGVNNTNGKVFTQEQVNKMMTREKNQGRSATLKELGIDPGDTKTLGMIKAFVESQKSDEQKAAEKSAEEETKIKEANQRALTAEAKAEAMTLGVKTQYVDDAVTLALAKMTDDSDLKTIIGEFKTKYPAWFDKSSDEDDKGGKTGQKGTGSSIKNSDKQKKGEEKGMGARLAAQRKSGNKKSSYWGK